MKANKYIIKCGPFKVSSMSQGRGGVQIVVYPAFPRYGDGWAITREKGEGGGPGIFTCMALAKELECFLNQPYSQEAIDEWSKTLDKALEKYHRLQMRRINRILKPKTSRGGDG